MKIHLVAAIAFACVLAACNTTRTTDAPETSNAPDPLRALMDTTVRPGDNFALYASGAWFNANPIPAHRSQNGIFQMVQDSVNKHVREICEHAAADANAKKGSAERKIGDFYASAMDTVNIEQQKLQPLQPMLDRINAMQTPDDVLRVSAEMRRAGASPLFGVYVDRDDMISTKYAVVLYQGGLGLPDRDYYTSNDGGTRTLRDEYVKHLSRLYQLTGLDATAAAKAAQDVMKLETALANASRRLEEMRDPYLNYNKYDLAGLAKLAPAMRWNEHATTLGFNKLDTVIVGQPDFMRELNKLLTSTPVATWKHYLTANALNTFAPFLHKELDNTVFDFYLGKLSGVKAQKPRWERAVEQTNRSLGDLIGQIYVRDYLPKGTKEKMEEIGANVTTVYRERIQNLDWMSDSTKQKALHKLSKVNMKLGYPDKWKDHATLEIDRSSYAANVIRANQWKYDYMVNKHGKPVNKDEWFMTPQTYNAYYSPSANEIVIPGSNIIVPGFQGLPDDAVLYAIIGGSIFGHEVTHGFDDKGSLYDAEGNLRNWWSRDDSIRFAQKTRAMVEQFNRYTVNDTLHLRGQATLGENIADLGGLVMGFEAFKKTDQYKRGEKIGGLTPVQRYFLGHAYAWMVNVNPSKLAHYIMTDVHAPPVYRVIGPVVHMPEFYEAFNVKEGDRFYLPPGERLVIW